MVLSAVKPLETKQATKGWSSALSFAEEEN
jgi:hypothetical protein